MAITRGNLWDNDDPIAKSLAERIALGGLTQVVASKKEPGAKPIIA